MREFFDGHSSSWDGYQRPQDFQRVGQVVDRIGPGPEDHVLDVGCGTGILVPYLSRKGVSRYLGMDLSHGMASEFRRKYPEWNILVGDFAQENLLPGSFSLVLIFNAFPHFDDEKRVFCRAFQVLVPGGRLVIAHSMNRLHLDEHHRKAGREVEDHVLISDEEFRRLYLETGFVDVAVEDSDYFFSRGSKPA